MRRAIGSIAGLLCLVALPPSAAAAAQAPVPLVWSAPAAVDMLPPFGSPTPLGGVSCPSASECAIAAGHQILSSSDPLGGFSAWRSTDLGSGLNAVAIACPTTATCVVVGGRAIVLVSGLWSGAPRRLVLTLPSVNSLGSAACPSTSLCMLGDIGGRLVTSEDPFGWPASWSVLQIGRNISSLWCLGATVCGLTDKGTLTMTLDPLADVWFGADAGVFAQSLSCASASFCVVVGDHGDVASATDPVNGPWTITPNVGGWGSVCAPPSLCLAFAGDTVYSADDPGTGPISWQAAPLPTGGVPNGAACPTEQMCVVGRSDGSLLTSTDPRGGSWRATQIAGTTALAQVACPLLSFCLAIDGLSHTLVSHDLTAGSASWRPRAMIDSGSSALGLACPSPSLCVAVASNGRILASDDPEGGAGAWTTADVDMAALTDVACPSTTLCVAVDAGGRVLTSSDPAGGASAWHAATVSGRALTGIVCSSSTRCLATDAGGRILRSDDPAGGAGAWHATQVDTSALTSIACPSATLCVATDVDGGVVTSTDPAGGPAAWQRAQAPGAEALDAVSCPSVSLCVAIDGEAIAASTRPAGGGSTWSTTVVDEEASVTDVACPSPTLCVATDDVGRVLLGEDPLGPAPALPRVELPPADDPPDPPAWDAAGIRTLLERALAGIERGARIPALLRRGSYLLSLRATVNGVAEIRWTNVPRRPARAVLVAHGSRAFAQPGRATIPVRLTRAGRRLLRHAARLRIVARATFAGAGRTSASATVTLRR